MNCNQLNFQQYFLCTISQKRVGDATLKFLFIQKSTIIKKEVFFLNKPSLLFFKDILFKFNYLTDYLATLDTALHATK